MDDVGAAVGGVDEGVGQRHVRYDAEGELIAAQIRLHRGARGDGVDGILAAHGGADVVPCAKRFDDGFVADEAVGTCYEHHRRFTGGHLDGVDVVELPI